MENIASLRGGEKFVEGGYIYVKNKNLAAGRISYECEMRKRSGNNSGQCKARLTVMDGIVVGRVNDHTHAPVAGRPEALRIRTAMKRRADDTMGAPQQILATCLQEVSEG